MNINREKFFSGYRKAFGSIKQGAVDAIDSLLGMIETDESVSDHGLDSRHFAYIFATIKHETANTYEPIEEYGKGRGRPYGRKDPVTGEAYYGRGFVQITWKKNYLKLGDLLGVDLVNEPSLALDPTIAGEIMIVGMLKGLFTGKKLFDYINDDKCDYVNARRVINGLDKAKLIAGYAEKFETILEGATEDAPSAPQLPVDAPKEEGAAQPSTTSVSVTDGNVKVETSDAPKVEEKVAIEKPASKGFAKELKTDFTAVTGGNLTLQGVRDYAEQAKLFGLSARFWLWISVIALTAGLAYLAAKVYKHWAESNREMEITNQLIAANSTPTNKIVLVDTEKIDEYKERGYKIVTR